VASSLWAHMTVPAPNIEKVPCHPRTKVCHPRVKSNREGRRRATNRSKYLRS